MKSTAIQMRERYGHTLRVVEYQNGDFMIWVGRNTYASNMIFLNKKQIKKLKKFLASVK